MKNAETGFTRRFSGAFRCGSCLAVLAAVLLLAGCPPLLPSGVQVVASPDLYLPLGSPGALANFSFDLDSLGSLATTGTGGGFEVYDYPGAYPETKAFLAIAGLPPVDFGYLVDAMDLIPPQFRPSSVTIPPLPPLSEGMTIDLGDLLAPLAAYSSLKFRNIRAYLYVSGPIPYFADGNVRVMLGAAYTPGAPGSVPQTDTLYNGPVDCLDFPLRAQSGPVESPLVPRPRGFDMTAIFNARPAAVEITCAIVAGEKTVQLSDLRANPSISVYLVLEMPLQFGVSDDFAVPIDPGAPDPARIDIAPDGLFNGGETDQILSRMESLTVESRVENFLGLAGFLQFNLDDGVSTPAGPQPSSAGKTIGRINLSGESRLRVTGEFINKNLPFRLWGRLILEGGQEIDIKRKAQDTPPLAITLGASVKTRIRENF